jgi:hypothetical protein
MAHVWFVEWRDDRGNWWPIGVWHETRAGAETAKRRDNRLVPLRVRKYERVEKRRER